jgi:hypothetical protein
MKQENNKIQTQNPKPQNPPESPNSWKMLYISFEHHITLHAPLNDPNPERRDANPNPEFRVNGTPWAREQIQCTCQIGSNICKPASPQQPTHSDEAATSLDSSNLTTPPIPPVPMTPLSWNKNTESDEIPAIPMSLSCGIGSNSPGACGC